MPHRKRGIEFVRNLIKGKIAEIVFQHMFAEAEFCTVIPFGYETIVPQLAQYQHLLDDNDALTNIRNAPDFILIKPDNTSIVLVDVKYRHKRNPQRVKDIALSMAKRWDTAWLFLATPDGFYFGPCQDIIEDAGEIKPLLDQWVKKDVQAAYLSLLREFEPS
jgi:hypothetical protein